MLTVTLKSLLDLYQCLMVVYYYYRISDDKVPFLFTMKASGNQRFNISFRAENC